MATSPFEIREPSTGPRLRRLLLATADDDLREVAHIVLEELLVYVLDAFDGPSALRLAREAVPDLLLLDASLPGLDPDAFLAALRAEPESDATPLFLFVPAGREEMAARAEADAWLPLPFDPPELARLVSALLRDPQPEVA